MALLWHKLYNIFLQLCGIMDIVYCLGSSFPRKRSLFTQSFLSMCIFSIIRGCPSHYYRNWIQIPYKWAPCIYIYLYYCAMQEVKVDRCLHIVSATRKHA